MYKNRHILRALVVKLAVACVILFQLVFRPEYIANFACGDNTKRNELVETNLPGPIPSVSPIMAVHSETIDSSQNQQSAFELFELNLENARVKNKHRMEVDFTGQGGKLCFLGSTESLDELIHVFTHLLFLGQQLKRIVVVPPYLSNLYDIYLLEMNGLVEVSKNQMLCDPREKTPNITKWNDQIHRSPLDLTLKKWPEALQNRKDEIIFIGGSELKNQEKYGMFLSKNEQKNMNQLLFTNLFPFKETRTTVEEFMSDNFGRDPFVAIHLSLSSSNRATTDPALIRWVLQQYASDLVTAPVFLSVDPKFQIKHAGIVRLFHELGAVTFDGPCHRRYERDLMTREIAAHSTFFYSTRNSATTKHIENVRRWRRGIVNNSFQLRAGVFRSFSIAEAREGGWKANKVTSADKTLSPTTIPTGPQSHYEKYLVKMENKKPWVAPEAFFPPNGVLCHLGLFEQLNNVIDQTAAMMMIGRQLGRTVVVPPLVSELYDISYLERAWRFPRQRMANGKMHRSSQATTNQSLCDPVHGWKYLTPNPKEGISKFIKRHSNETAPVLAMSARDLFHYGFSKRKLFKHLHPYKETRDIALKFIDEKFGTEPFVAVHLRFLDGKCYKVNNGDVACDLDPELLAWILKNYAPKLINAKVFVASDHQRPDLEAAFAKAGAVFYRGKCHSYDKECMVIDAEIASRSAYFYGLHLSTAAQNIERFRRQRDNGSPYNQLRAFPHITDEFGPMAGEWTPRRWQGSKRGESPEKYFASRPREDMDLVAVTAAPVSAIYSSGGLQEESRGMGDRSENMNEGTRLVDAEERTSSCHQQINQWLAPNLWLVLFFMVAYPRVHRRGGKWSKLRRLSSWSMRLYYRLRMYRVTSSKFSEDITSVKKVVPASSMISRKRRAIQRANSKTVAQNT